jgi:Fibronectin type III domain/NHL repeat
MHGLMRRFAMAAGTAALALGYTASAAITTGTAAQAAGPVTLPFTGLNQPGGVAVDAAGNVYVANSGFSGLNTVLELPHGSVSQVASGFEQLENPAGLAVDAAGDVFAADSGFNDVVELQHGSNGSVSNVTLPFTGLNDPQAVAVDGFGDVFVANLLNNLVAELPNGPNGYGSQVTLPFTGLNQPSGVAVDGAGDVFVADSGNRRVVELPHGNNGYGSQVTLPFTAPIGPIEVAVDGAGDLVVTDDLNQQVVELPRGSTSQVTLATGLADPWAVAVDTSGDVFVTEISAGQVVELPRAVVPFHIPGAPKITSATAGDGQATVAFTPSQADLNRGDPPATYTVTARAGVGVTSGPGITATGTTSSITVTGLTNGTTYTVTVYATNGAGSGPQSAHKLVTPATVPGAPTNVTATNTTPPNAASGTVDLTFTPPASDGGRPVLSYTAVSSPDGITATAGAGAGIQVTGLTIGTSYTFTVYATNAVGNGPVSAPSNAVIPAPVPSPPQVPGAATLDQAAYVSCLPPVSDGGSPIVSYTVTSSPGGITATGSSCPILVTGLTDGTKYSFTVTATNAAGGTSQPSKPTSKITPHAPSGPPPANDNFANAKVIKGTSGSVTGTNVGATVEPGEQTIQDNRGGASVWYKWTVPVTGSYRFDTCTANPGVVGLIGLFTGNSVSTATEFPPGPGSDLCPAGEAGSTIITGTMSAGLTLYIKFDGLNENGSNANPPYEGPFTLEWFQQS